MKKNKLLKITTITIFLILLLVGFLYFALKQVNNFFNNYSITFNQIVNVQFKEPMTFNKRVEKVKIISPILHAKPEEVDTPIKEYACKKFGDFHCLTMIAIFQAESGWNNEAWNYNTNDTLDYGIAQINSVNWKLDGCSLKEIVDPYKNIDCAYKMWDRADGQEGDKKGSFKPWVAYLNDSHLGFLQ